MAVNGHGAPGPAVHRTLGNQRLMDLVQPKLRIGAPGDRYEREADRVADRVMRMPDAGMGEVQRAQRGIQRKCAACSSGAGPCPKCEEEARLQRKPVPGSVSPVMQRGQDRPPAAASRDDTPVNLTPGGGRPLAAATRSFFEPRFGRNFADVRIHTGAEADHNASAINASAYTLGNHITFAAGRYRPDTFAGRKLLAHELTHVTQQGGAAGRGVVQQAPLMVARGRDDPNPSPPPSPPPPEPTPPAENHFICGPDVSTELRGVISSIDTTFNTTYNSSQKNEACNALDSVFSGALVSWDVIELHIRDWIYQNYRPACATQGATPPCGQTVEVDNECYYGGTPNYVIFGKMCKLCHSHHAGTADANRFTRDATLGLVDRYKGPGSLLGQAPNWQPSRAWAAAGYDGWPGGGSPPAGDRSNCDPSCSIAFPAATGPQSFRWRWCPHTDPAGQC